MDRRIVYPAQVPLVEDQLYSSRYAEIGIGRLAGALYGENTIGASGLACTAGTGLAVVVAPGQIIQAGVVDASAYGVLPASSDPLPIQYLLNEAQTLTISAAGATYQIYATLATSDTDGAVLPFYNSANPSQVYAGPSNDGTSSPALRQSALTLGIATAVPSGAIPLWTITVTAAATSITSDMIAQAEGAPFWMTLPELYALIETFLTEGEADQRYLKKDASIPGRLLNIQRFTSSGTYAPTEGVAFIIVQIIGSGASGYGVKGQSGTTTVSIGSGGNSGTYAEVVIQNPSTTTVTIGAQTGNGYNGTSVPGNLSSFGDYVSCPGGAAAQGYDGVSPIWAVGNHSELTPTIGSGAVANVVIGDLVGGEAIALAMTAGFGGFGANSKFGAGGGNIAPSSVGDDGQGYGSGGSGTFSPQSGGALLSGRGAQGYAIVFEYGG